MQILKYKYMGTKNFVDTIAGVIESASDKHFTLDAEQVMEFVKQVIAAITEEFRLPALQTGNRCYY